MTLAAVWHSGLIINGNLLKLLGNLGEILNCVDAEVTGYSLRLAVLFQRGPVTA